MNYSIDQIRRAFTLARLPEFYADSVIEHLPEAVKQLKLTLQYLFDEFCSIENINKAEFLSKKRSDEMFQYRLKFTKLAKVKFPEATQQAIGDVLNRDHASVLRYLKILKGKELKSKKINLAMDLIALDTVFSLFVRQRDADPNGIINCISCGQPVYWKEADCGHYIDRRHRSTRFDEHNGNAQCQVCNRFSDGNMDAYRVGLIRKIGLDCVLELERKKYQTKKFSQYEIDQLAKYFKEKIKSLN